MIPKKVFFTKGMGVNKNKLASFEQALRNARIEKFNLVHVSSIIPQGCETIPKSVGLKLLKAGQILFIVMSRNSSNEQNRLISAAIGMAKPSNKDGYGYLSEYHAFDKTAEKSGEYAEDLAATMLATTLGIEFDPETAWDERKRIYSASGKIIKTTNICQSAECNMDGCWTTVIAAAVFIV